MGERRDYIYKTNFLSGIVPDQTVIFKKSLFKHLPGIKMFKEPDDETVSFALRDAEKWYPLVNSYYPFTEDVDAFARVHHLLEAKGSSESLDTTKLPRLIHEYSDIRALNQYLRSKPICFLILGKPGLGQEEVGRRLAEYWRCVYIDPLTLLQEEIESESRPGECIEFNLRCGRAIGIDVLTRLLTKKVQTAQVLHRGFVCCGFPLVANDLYEEDPISSESAVFNVREIFEDLLDLTVYDISTKVAVSVVDSSKEPTEEGVSEEGVERVSSTHITMDWSIENQVCGPSEIGTDLEKQLNCIFGVFRDPYLIIYPNAKNSDVVSKRDNYFFDIYSNKTIDMQKVRMFYDVGASNEELIEDLFGNGSNPFAGNPTLQHVVKLPENFPANVDTQLDRYHSEIANFLDAKVLRHSCQYYIRMDGRAFISQMLQAIKLRLTVLALRRVIIPQEFDTPQQDIGEGAEPNEMETMPPEEAFELLSRKDVIQPVFKWGWSNWGTFCPVSMYRGIYERGLSKYAIRFADKIYFLANERNYYKFIDNPRSFLLPPYPKPGCSVLLFGPPLCGKSVVAECLGYLLSSKVITPDEMHEEYLQQTIDEYKEQVKQIAIIEALEILEEKYLKETEERNQEIQKWVKEATDSLEALNAAFTESGRESKSGQISSFPLKIERDIDTGSKVQVDMIRKNLEILNIPEDIDQKYCLELLSSNISLTKHLPEELKVEIPSPSVWDPFVLEYANAKVDAIELDDLNKKVDQNLSEMFTRFIRSSEQQASFDGCIIDGMVTNVAVLQHVCEEFQIQDIIILTSSDSNYLIEKFKKGKQHEFEFRGFQEFLLSIKEVDAAWRVPPLHVKSSYGIAADIVSDIITAGFSEEAIASERQASLERYQEALIQYEEEIKEAEKTLEGFGLRPLYIDVNDLTTEDLLKEVVTVLRDKYRIPAFEFTEADRAEEVQQFISQPFQAQGGEAEGTTQQPDEFFAMNRRYGDTYYYDPVNFSNKFVLWRGKEQFGATFKNKVYLFSSQANLTNFIKSPRKYLVQTSPPEVFPPPRICVIGPNVELRRSVCTELARNIGTLCLDFAKIQDDAINALSSISLLYEPVAGFELTDSLLFGMLDTVFSRLWFEEPLKYKGFVLGGFPRKEFDLNYMLSQEAIPDVIVYIHMSYERHLKLQLETSLSIWRDNMQKQRRKTEAIHSIFISEWEEKRKSRYNELIETKRQSRYSKKISEGNLPLIEEEPNEKEDLLSETQISVDSIIEQQEHDEVIKILDEELPEPVFEEFIESEEQVIEQFTTKIEERYKTDMKNLEQIKKMCDVELIPFIEIDGDREFDKVVIHAYILGNDIKFRGACVFERCYDVSMNVAEKLLSSGYCFSSCFGNFCPVQYYIGHNRLHMYFAREAEDDVYPVIHRQYIYFLHGKKNRASFHHNPLKYTAQKRTRVVLIPAIIAIIGPPKSGKSTLANRIKHGLGFRSVSHGQAIRFALSSPLYSNLNATMEKVLRKGEELTDEMVVECVHAATFGGEAVTQGLVFDGFPNTVSEMNALAKQGLVPHIIFDLQITDDALYNQAAKPSGKTPHYSQAFIAHLCDEWEASQKLFRKWCHREYQNIHKLAVDRTIWGVWDHAKEVILTIMFERKHYYERTKLDLPLRLAHMLVTPIEFLERQSLYKTYCPGCILNTHELNSGGDPPDRRGLVQYQEFFYWLCKKHVDEFVTRPDKFIPPNNVGLPEDLPQIVKLTEHPENPVEDGYCVVCYQHNFPKKVLEKGAIENAVKYQGRLYLFDSTHCMTCFMGRPSKLNHVTIHFKEQIPAKLEYRDLPVLGMLEQFVARTLVRALGQANAYRPVIPGLSISQAAFICVGLNLKVHNPKTGKYLKKYEEALQIFHKRRLDLIHYLDLMKKYLNPFVHYEEPNTPSSTSDSDEEVELFDQSYI